MNMLVVFYFKTEDGTGIGNAYMEFDSFHCTEKEMVQVVKEIQKDNPSMEQVCILNIIPLKGAK